MNRRTFVKSSVAAAVALAAVKNTEAAEPAGAAEVKEPVPVGKLCGKPVSRLLLGGNLLTHFCHSRDLKYVCNLTAHYNTDAKILETLALAEAHGINTLVIHTVPRALSVLKEYRRRGGKMQWIICPTAMPGTDEYGQVVKQLVEDGAEFVYLWGVQADRLAAEGNSDLIARAVDTIKDHEVPCGVGAHDLKVIELCEEKKIPADFYLKTFHHHKYPTAPRPEQLTKPYSEIPGYWCQDPQRTIEVMRQVAKPWIAFKVMAAGAIPPESAFQFVFQNGADFSLAGMFDFEIEPDVRILNKLWPTVQKRARPWYG